MMTFTLVFAGLWATQMLMSWWQSKRFLADIAALRSHGVVFIGRGKRRGLRAYAALALRDGVVTDSRILNGYTVFSRAKACPELTGLPVGQLTEGPVGGLDRRTAQAVTHAATLYVEHNARKRKVAAA
ncbi:transcriptional regulator GutM [Mycolicibacterium cosmeticum]|uniref:transcriptional regulator GutM n=1 Tax=Mycolicibacterium cosmeticum TaxID=258533 RepID=UPI00041CD3C7